MATARIDAALRRLKGTFLQNPACPLTLQDAADVSGVDVDTCRILLAVLADVRFQRSGGAATFVCARTEDVDA
jgi:hypothetical protein